MTGDRRETGMARWRVLAAAAVVAGVTLSGAVHPVAAAEAGEAGAVTAVVGATDLPTSGVTVPVVTVPPVTVPPVPGTVVPPKVSLTVPIPSTSSSGGATTVPAGSSSSDPVTTTGVAPSSSAPPVVTAPAARTTAGGLPRATTQAGQAKPTGRSLSVRLRQAAAETVRQLTFPLGLALATLAFLVFQHRVDKGDPRVEASLSGDDDLLGFS